MSSPERAVIENLLRIPDKEGREVDFKLWPEQAEFDRNRTGRDVIVKFRQGGFSLYAVARALVDCLGRKNRRHVIIAHNSDTTTALLAHVHYMVRHLKGPAPHLRHNSRNIIAFEKTESQITIGTAGSGDFGVGHTITDLHCSEASRWTNPEQLLAGLFQAVPKSGNILIESTARGVGNWFYRTAQEARLGIGYKLHFFNWLKVADYSLDVSPETAARVMTELNEAIDEPLLVEKYGLTAGQLLWRRSKIAEMGNNVKLFKENYPLSFDEAFQATGYNLFSEINYVETPEWHIVDPWSYVLGDHPRKGRMYIAGADVALGVGSDYSVLVIYDIETGEQVYQFRSNTISPDRFAARTAETCRKFNTAYLNPERNATGYLFLQTLLNTDYPVDRLHQPVRKDMWADASAISALQKYGTYMTDVNKAYAIQTLKAKLREEFRIFSPELKQELLSFVEKPNGSLGAEEGAFDDTVMASALVAFAWEAGVNRLMAAKNAATYETAVNPNATLNVWDIINRHTERSRMHGLPISPGVVLWPRG